MWGIASKNAEFLVLGLSILFQGDKEFEIQFEQGYWKKVCEVLAIGSITELWYQMI